MKKSDCKKSSEYYDLPASRKQKQLNNNIIKTFTKNLSVDSDKPYLNAFCLKSSRSMFYMTHSQKDVFQSRQLSVSYVLL